MKLALMVVVAFASTTRMGLAAPAAPGSVESAALPKVPTATEMAKILGFPAKVHFQVISGKTSRLLPNAKPLAAFYYLAEKQTPYSYSLEIYRAGSLFGVHRREEEASIEKFTNDQQKSWEKHKEEALLSRGYVVTKPPRDADLITVETRPDGRKVYITGFAMGPGGGILGAFTKVGDYDVLLVQYAFGSDGDDPEEAERMKAMAFPTLSLPAAFANLEKVMPIFLVVTEAVNEQGVLPLPAATGSGTPGAITPEAVTTGAVTTGSAPPPQRPTVAQFVSCLDLLKPAKFHSYSLPKSPLFHQFESTWVSVYSADMSGTWGYSVEIYPARTLFGAKREWLERWLEAHSLHAKKAGEPLSENLPEAKTKPPAAPASAVVTRPDGRKVYFRLFTMTSGAPAPTVFSTIGDYDVVLTQFSYSTEPEDLTARKKVAPRLGMLQAFARLEALLQ